MPSDWIQDRDAVIDNPEVINVPQKQTLQQKPSVKKRRRPIFHDDNLRDEQPPHLADIPNVSHDF